MPSSIWPLIGGLAVIVGIVAGIVEILDYLEKRRERKRQVGFKEAGTLSPIASSNLSSQDRFVGREDRKAKAKVKGPTIVRNPLARIGGPRRVGKGGKGSATLTVGQEPTERYDNPFYHRDSIKDQDYFFGRERETRAIIRAISRGQCVSVVGPRHIGKTSLLFHIADEGVLTAHGLVPSDFIVVYCTGQGLQGDGEGSLQNYLLERVCTQLSVSVATRSLEEMVENLTRQRLRVVFLLDEFELFATKPGGSEGFFHNLRALQSQHALALITSSQTSLRELSSHDESSLPSNFFQMFHLLNLGLFSPKEARSLIGLSQRAGITFSERTTDFILTTAGLHPFFLVVACDHVFDRRSSQTELDASDYESLRREIGGELESHFRYYWDDTLDRAQQSVLVNLGAVQTSSGQAQCLRELMQLGLVVREGRGYRYVSDAFKEFVLRHHATLFLEHDSKSLIGRELGSVRIVGKIGSGGMATVYKAYHPMLDLYVAVKVLSRDIQREGFLPRFRREAQAVAKLDHPNILSIYDFGQEEDLAYIVMRYVPSGTLADLISPEGLLLGKAVDIAIQVGGALHHAHQQGIVHRDVKPSNILIDPDGKSLLADFGLVKSLKTPGLLTEPGSMMGTAAYAAPEQLRGEKTVDARSDVYALGIVLYEMVAGRLPFDAEDGTTVLLKKLEERLPPSPRQFRPNLPEEVEQVILKAIAPQSDERYQSAFEMTEALRAIAKSMA